MKPANPAALFPVVAHQGGWDEILMVVVPLAIIGLLLWLANRRVSAQLAAGEGADKERASGRTSTSGADEHR
jgi:hypothetical protein